MVALQLITDEGAFICNIFESDMTKIAAREPGTFVVIHHAIRLDAMTEGQYELHKAKTVEAATIDTYQPFHKEAKHLHRKSGPVLDAGDS